MPFAQCSYVSSALCPIPFLYFWQSVMTRQDCVCCSGCLHNLVRDHHALLVFLYFNVFNVFLISIFYVSVFFCISMFQFFCILILTRFLYFYLASLITPYLNLWRQSVLCQSWGVPLLSDQNHTFYHESSRPKSRRTAVAQFS